MELEDLEKTNFLTDININTNSCREIDDQVECKIGACVKSSLKYFLLNLLCLKKVTISLILEVKLEFNFEVRRKQAIYPMV